MRIPPSVKMGKMGTIGNYWKMGGMGKVGSGMRLSLILSNARGPNETEYHSQYQ